MSDAKRDYIFIDESGDPGEPSDPSTTNYYMVHALHLTDSSIKGMFGHLNRLRYFHGLDKELKNIHRNSTILNILLDIFNWANNNEIYATSTYLEKEEYKGPYLSRSGPKGYKPQYFRNFIIRRTLERHFYANKKKSSELEIVIDRFITKREEEDNLVKYLKGNFKLPEILHIVQVDSRYSSPIQLVDLLGRLLKAKHIDEWGELNSYDFDFVNLICLNEIPKEYPNKLGEKK